MSTAETIVIQCPACEQKYRWHAERAGQLAPCQKCQHVFPAVDIEKAIPPEFDDAVPVPRKQASPPPVEPPRNNTGISHETELRLEAKRLAAQVTTHKAVASGIPIVQGWLIIALLAAVVAVGVMPKKQGLTKWEYKIAGPDDLTFESSLSGYGAEGWEVVSARRANDGITNTFKYELILKRPRQ